MKILVADHSLEVIEILSQMLEDNGHQVITAGSGAEAIERANEDKPDAMLLGIVLPDMSGFNVCRRLKSADQTRTLPIIFIVAETGDEDKIAYSFDLGANDYITYPFKKTEVLSRLDVAKRLREAEEKVKSLSIIDELTGLYSRALLHRRFEEELSRARRHKSGLACALIDIDHFREINSKYGHQTGDHILKTVAHILQENTRKEDFLARLTGERFIVVLSNYTAEAAWVYGERMRRAIESYNFSANNEFINITISLGVACYSRERENEDIDSIIKRSTDALHQAKATGRNNVVLSLNVDGEDSVLCW